LKNLVNKIHQNAQRERDRIGFIATMYANNKFNKKAIDALAEANKAAAKQAGKEIPEDNVSAEYNINGNKSEVILKGITMKDIPVFESITGRKITNNNGVFSMKFPFIGPLYYNSRHQNIDYDFTNLAMAVRASGFSKITMRINYPADEKYAEELGRRQYEAAVKAGFDPNDMGDKDKKAAITIVVNGKEMKAEELFKGHEARLGAIKGVYAKESVIRTKEYNSTSPARHEEFKEFKTAVKNKLEELKQEDLNKANPVVDEKSEKDEQNLDENVSKNEF
jgi:hypothetical protein